jgi:hypothetical protein
LGAASLYKTYVLGGSAGYCGGAIFNAGITSAFPSGGSPLHLVDSAVDGTQTLPPQSPHNQLGGGGICNSGLLTVAGGSIAGTAGETGGGLYNLGVADVTAATIRGSALYGGTVSNLAVDLFGFGPAPGHLTLTDVAVRGGQAVYSGGGIYNGLGATLVSTRTTITNSGASDLHSAGGGIMNGGTAALFYNVISNNGASQGGGIADFGLLTLVGGRVTGNYARQGGCINSFGGPAIAVGVTFSGNNPDNCAPRGKVKGCTG